MICTDTVLLIDDNEIDLFISKKILQVNQFSNEILTTTSPRHALSMLADESSQLPEVLFLDLNMPIMDGFRFLQEFAQLSDYVRDNVAIVVLTSSENVYDREMAARTKCVFEFVSKPLTDDKVRSLKKALSSTKVKSLQN